MNATQENTINYVNIARKILTPEIRDLMKRKRWTILDVDESIIKQVKQFAMENGYTTAGALKELIMRALHGKRKS